MCPEIGLKHIRFNNVILQIGQKKVVVRSIMTTTLNIK